MISDFGFSHVTYFVRNLSESLSLLLGKDLLVISFDTD